MVAQKGQSQINLPKHETVSQSTNQFPETQITLLKHKTVSQNTNQFSLCVVELYNNLLIF